MPRFRRALAAALATTMVLAAGAALAQGKGRIICWQDKSGKIVGCGDSVPPEYQDAATRELDKRGMTRKTRGTAEEEAKAAAEAEELKKKQEEQKRQQADQRRRDTALLNTYANEREIDQRRDRELQQIERMLSQFRTSHKSAVARHAQAVLGLLIGHAPLVQIRLRDALALEQILPAVVFALRVVAGDFRRRDVRADAREAVGLGDVGDDARQRLAGPHPVAFTRVEPLHHSGNRRLHDDLALRLDDPGFLDEHLHVAAPHRAHAIRSVARVVGVGGGAGEGEDGQDGNDGPHA